jgi:hypothetical protein
MDPDYIPQALGAMDLEQIRKQRLAAADLVGKYVRFAHMPEEIKPTPIRVTGARNGMIELEGWAGEFAPHLFVEVEPPKGNYIVNSLGGDDESRKDQM